MEEVIEAVDRLPDDQLIATVKSLAVHERLATARLVAALAEMERRQLYLGQGCGSLYDYCTQVLQLSEDAAYNRAQVAQVGLKYPVVLRDLESGDVSLTAIRLLRPFLTAENHAQLLAAVRHKPKRDVVRLVAALNPDAVLSEPPLVTPIGPDRYRVQFVASQALHDKLFQAQDLLRHVIPNGDLAAVIERGLDAVLAELGKRTGETPVRPRRSRRSRSGTRRIPARVERAVWRRDGGRCAFVGAQGRCRAHAFLQVHHVVPFAAGGATTLSNLELRCRAHNVYEAEQWLAASGKGNGPPFRNG